MGPAQAAEPRSENNVSTPSDAYGISKWHAENALREEFAADRMSVVIVRPTLVYGMNAKGNLQALARGVQKGLPRPPSGGKRSMIALQDLVELLCVIARQPPAGVTTWIASGTESYSTREIYDLLHTVGGIGSGIGWLPRWAWWAGAQLADLAFGRVGESRYQKLFGTELYSNAAVLSATDWRPQIRLQDTIGQIARSGFGQP
jgi:nucleoside-diphosphate-sugar epimerase